MRNYGTATCVTCGNMFAKTGTRGKYCSKECTPSIYEHVCEYCGKTFPSNKAPSARFCSWDHTVKAKGTTPVTPGRKLSKGYRGFHPNAPAIILDTPYGEPSSWVDNKGYVSYYWPSHPASPAGRSRLGEHRAVAYEIYGDAIEGNHVDHIDGDKMNNDPSNLRVMSASEHLSHTAKNQGMFAFYQWVQENRPEYIQEWVGLRVIGD